MRSTNRRRFGCSRKVLIVPALVAFIAVDIILIALALGWGRGESRAVGHSSRAEMMAPVQDEQGVANGAVPSPRMNEDAVRSAPRNLSVTSDSVAWRAEGGACDERGSLELTIDGGETWGAAYSPADGLGRPLWVSGSGYTTVQSAIASGANCEPKGVRTFDSGASWTQDEQVVTNSVLVDPNDPSRVVWGGEAIDGPCGDMAQVAVTGGVASVVCGDGALWSVPWGEGEWTQTAVAGAVAVSGSDGRWIAAVTSSDCDGLRLVEFDEAQVEPLACAPTGPSGSTALDFAGNTLWLWVEDRVLVSPDLGRSFG